MKVKITQITAGDASVIFGLGEDNKVYYWDEILGAWQPYKV